MIVLVAFAVAAFALAGVASAQPGTSAPSSTAAVGIVGPAVGAIVPSGSAVSASCLVGNNPEGVAYDPSDHDVHVADSESGDGGISILKAPCTVIATIHLGTDIPYGVAYDPSLHEVLVSDSYDDQVYFLKGTSIVTILGGFCSPGPMTWDAPANAMLVVDYCGGVDAIFGSTEAGVQLFAINDCQAASLLVADRVRLDRRPVRDALLRGPFRRLDLRVCRQLQHFHRPRGDRLGSGQRHGACRELVWKHDARVRIPRRWSCTPT